MLNRILSLFAVTTASVAMAGPVVHGAAPASRQLTDARILGTIGAADANQIESAKLAATKANSKDVRSYASMMVHDHQESLRKNTQLAKRFHLERLLPEDSVMAREHKQEMAQLNILSGAAFDLAFLQAMVSDHAALIRDVNTTLLPAVTRKEVKEYVRGILPVLAVHQTAGQALLDKQK